MTFRPDIVAGRAVVLVDIEENIDRQLRKIRAKLRRFSNSLGNIGGDMFRFGAVGSLGALFPLNEFVKFQDQLLFTQTKLQATNAEMKELEQTIRAFGKSTSFTSTQVGEAAQRLAQAGFSIKEVEGSLQASLDIARAGQMDLSTATDIMANTVRSYGLSVDQTSLVSSKFITAARLGTLNIVDLNEALKNSATTFRLLGMDLSNSLALITRLSTASLRGTIAGTSLNRAFQKLAMENEKLAKAGIVLDEEDLSNPIRVLEKLEAVTKVLPKRESVEFLNKLLGIRGGRGVGGIIIQELDGLRGIIDEIEKSSNEARKAADKLDSRLGGVYRRALSAFQELMLSLAETLERPLTIIGEGLRVLFNGLSELAKENPKLIQTMFAIPPLMLAGGSAMLVMASGANILASALTPLIFLTNALFDSLQRIAGYGAYAITAPFMLGGKQKKSQPSPQKALRDTRKALAQARGRSYAAYLQSLPSREFGASTGKRINLKSGPIVDLRRLTAASRQTTTNFVKFEDSLAASNLAMEEGAKKTEAMQKALDDLFDTSPKQLTFLNILDEIAATPTKAAAKTRDLAEIYNQTVRASIALFTSQGFRRRGGDLSDALTEVMEAQSIPRQLRSRIEKQLAERMVPEFRPPKLPSAKQLEFDFTPMPAIRQTIGRGNRFGSRGAAPNTPIEIELSGIRNGIRLIGKAASSVTRPIKAMQRAFKNVFRVTSWVRVLAFIRGIGTALTSSFSESRFKRFGFMPTMAVYIHRIRKAFTTGRWLSKAAAGLKTIFSGLKLVFVGIKNILFTASGWLMIIDFLVLFGARIKPIRNWLESVGEAFRLLAAGIGEAFSNLQILAPTFSKVMEMFASGQGESAGILLTQGIRDSIALIKGGLWNAWADFINKLSPTLTFIRDAFNLTIKTFNVGIEGAVGLLDNLFSGLAKVSGLDILGKALISGDGEGEDGGLSALQKVMTGLVGLMGVVLGSLQQMVSIVISTMFNIQAAVAGAMAAIVDFLPGNENGKLKKGWDLFTEIMLNSRDEEGRKRSFSEIVKNAALKGQEGNLLGRLLWLTEQAEKRGQDYEKRSRDNANALQQALKEAFAAIRGFNSDPIEVDKADLDINGVTDKQNNTLGNLAGAAALGRGLGNLLLSPGKLVDKYKDNLFKIMTGQGGNDLNLQDKAADALAEVGMGKSGLGALDLSKIEKFANPFSSGFLLPTSLIDEGKLNWLADAAANLFKGTEKQQEQVRQIRLATESVVGSFADTRMNKVMLNTETIQEKQLAVQERIAKGVEKQNNDDGVFGP